VHLRLGAANVSSIFAKVDGIEEVAARGPGTANCGSTEHGGNSHLRTRVRHLEGYVTTSNVGV